MSSGSYRLREWTCSADQAAAMLDAAGVADDRTSALHCTGTVCTYMRRLYVDLHKKRVMCVLDSRARGASTVR